jgi:4-amino-4-deoxy-L-arabinose transferase-like glycosyltransferase
MKPGPTPSSEFPSAKPRSSADGALGRESWFVFGLALALMMFPVHAIPVVWDEGLTFERQEAMADWFGAMSRADGDQWNRLWARPTRDVGWRFSKEEPDGHSPFYALLSKAGDLTTGWLLSKPASLRIGTAALWSLTLAQIFLTVRRRFDRITAWLAVVLVGTMPRLVSECSFALIDGPLVCLALLAACRFTRALETGRTIDILLFGACLGAAMATKLTGWFLLAPYLGWTLWRMDRGGCRILLIAIPTAAVVCFGFNVGWWPDPLGGFRRYLESNLSRDRTIPIPILFLGEIHPFSLPWYNTLVWMALAVPVGTLVLGTIGVIVTAVDTFPAPFSPRNGLGRRPGWFGLASWWSPPANPLPLRERVVAERSGEGLQVGVPHSASARQASSQDGFGTLLLANWLLLMVLRALPQAPGHDGTRQLVIALGFLGMLAAYAVGTLARSGVSRVARFTVLGLGLAAALESAASTAWYHPFGLSYYSPLAGGLPGADRLGMEPTYFWDGLTPDVLSKIDELAADGSVMFRHNPASLRYLTRWGRLRTNHDPAGWAARPPVIVVYQNRPGQFLDADRRLWNGSAPPLFEKKLFGVPLIRIYSMNDYRAAQVLVP